MRGETGGVAEYHCLMADCTCACPGPTCITGDTTIDATDAGGCTTVDLVISDSNTVDLSVVSNVLEATMIVDPNDNVIREPGNGLHVPQFAVATSTREQAWTEVGIGDNPRHITEILIPPGDWFIALFWNGWIKKANNKVSDNGSETYWRLGIDEVHGRRKRHRWGATAGVLGHAGTQIPVEDSYSRRVTYEVATVIECVLQTGITSSRNEANEIDYHGSVLSVMAIREFD